MFVKKILSQIFMAAGLSAPVIAIEPSTHVTMLNGHKLYASEIVLGKINAYKDKLLSLAGKDIIVVSRNDFMSEKDLLNITIYEDLSMKPQDIYPIDTIRADVSEHFKQYEQVLYPDTLKLDLGILNKYAKPFINIIINNFITDAISKPVLNGNPVSLNIPASDSCVIVAPDQNMEPTRLITQLAGFPPNMSGMVKTNAEQDIVYEMVMLHEARHCAQQLMKLDDEIDVAINRLEKELDADVHSHSIIYENAENIEEVNSAIADIQLSRSLATLRNGGNLFDGANEYLSHGAKPSSINQNDLGRDVNAADIILATKITNTFISLGLSLQTNTFLSFSRTSEAVDEKYNLHETVRGTFLEDFIYRAEAIRQNEPLIEYAFIKAGYEAISQTGILKDFIGLSKTHELSLSILEDYITAFEILVPEAKNHPTVKAQMELTRAYFNDLNLDTERALIDTHAVENASVKVEQENLPQNKCLNQTNIIQNDSEKLLRRFNDMTNCLILEAVESRHDIYRLDQEIDKQFTPFAP